MPEKSDPDERRILKSPAVRPCEGISPTTLIASLINLSHSIVSNKPNSFPSQKRVAREVSRQVGILVVFFEEIRDHGSGFGETLGLGFSELHFALQKIRFLLEDCTREGSRLYILMKSHFIANQFQVLVRLVSTSLDVIRLDSLGISREVREIVELLIRQARKVRLDTDPDDQCAMKWVRLVLNEFENRFEAERSELKRVLDYLGIKTWVECSKEVKFLENEMSNLEEDERETPLLSNLTGFLCYCRGVIFDTMDESEQTNSQIQSDTNSIFTCLNPEDFRCPISLELMVDPVTVSTGQTYDRSSIQKWLKAGHMLCPKTGEKLESTDLVPNLALKKLIHHFCSDKGISLSKSGKRNRDISRKTTSPSPAAKEAIRFLAQFLAGRLTYGTNEQKNKAANEIRLLTKSNIFNRSILIEVGNVPPLLDLLTSPDPETQENAIAAVLKLSKHPKGQKAIITEGGLNLLVSVLRRGLRMESRQMAAATIFYLSSVDRYRKFIGLTKEAIPALIELIKDGTLSGKKNALAAIFGLLLYHGNHERALEAGIVPLLVDLIACNERSDLVADSLAVLSSLAERIDGSIAILQTPALNLIMGLLKSSISQTAKGYCVSVLLSLSNNGGSEVISTLAKEANLMTTLYSLIIDGTSNACKKAITLINMLQKFHESSSSSLAATSAIRKERIIQEL